MVGGVFCAEPLSGVSSWTWLRRLIVMSVMFAMALPLSLTSITETLRRPGAALLASCINFGLLPLVAWGLSGMVDPRFAAGFLVVAATPCTLASAAVWTRRAGGNDVTALMTTVITNFSSFLMTPLIVFWLLQQQAEIPFVDLVSRLALLVLLPIVLAQLLAGKKQIGNWAKQRKKQLGIAAQTGILAIVLLGTAQSRLRLSQDQLPTLFEVFPLIAWCVVLHVTVLLTGYGLAKVLGFAREQRIAVAFAGSQKTLMIGLLVCIYLNVSLVPMVIYHASQLLIDTFVADRFAASQRNIAE